MIIGSIKLGQNTVFAKTVGNFDEMFTQDRKPFSIATGISSYIPQLESQGIQCFREFHLMNAIEDAKPFLLCLDDIVYQIEEKTLDRYFHKEGPSRNFGVHSYYFRNLFEKTYVLPATMPNILCLCVRRCHAQIRNLGSQLFPPTTHIFMSAYEQAVGNNMVI